MPRLQRHSFSILISHCSFPLHSSPPPPPHPFLFHLPLSHTSSSPPSSRPVHRSLPRFYPRLFLPPRPRPPSFLFIICWRAECGRMLVIWRSDCIGHAWMIPNLVPNILSLWVMTLIITNGGWWIPGASGGFCELLRAGITRGALKGGNWIPARLCFKIQYKIKKKKAFKYYTRTFQLILQS